MGLHYLETEDISSETVQYCAGLPFVQERILSDFERRSLLAESRRKIRWMVILVLSLPVILSCIHLLSVLTGGNGLRIPQCDGLPFFFATITLIFGLPPVLLIVNDLRGREKIIRKGAKAGRVRLYEGKLNPDDWTDQARLLLMKKGLLDTREGVKNQIELFGACNIVYTINGVRVKSWVAAEPTTAAPPGSSTAYFALPAAWGTEASESGLERRRLSQIEIDEVLTYAKGVRWSLPKSLPVVVMLGVIVTHLSRVLERFALGLPPRASDAFVVGVPVVFCLVLYFRRRRLSAAYLRDAGDGWAFLCSPLPGEPVIKNRPSVPFEFLPNSGAVWIVGGKPAAWRRKPVD